MGPFGSKNVVSMPPSAGSRHSDATGASPSGEGARWDGEQVAVEWNGALADLAMAADARSNLTLILRNMLEHIHHEAIATHGNVRDAGRAIGGRLADMFHGNPAALEATLRVLLIHLPLAINDQPRGLSRDERADLVGALAAGYAAHPRTERVEAQHGTPRSVVHASWTAQPELFESEAKFRTVFDDNIVGMCICDLRYRIINANAALLDIVGRNLHDIIGKPAGTVFTPTARNRNFPWDRFDDVASGRIDNFHAEGEFVRRDGTVFWIHVSSSLIREQDGTPSYMINLIQEITDRKAFEQQLEWRATHDPLTRLPNQMHFHHLVEQALTRSAPARRSVAILLVDLDRFKVINDSFGHYAGDQTLVAVGQCLKSILQSNETVARLGGDEFAVLIANANPELAKATASRILGSLSKPFPVLHRLMTVEASIGIAVSNDKSLLTTDSLIRAADLAQYRAKALGRATAVCFEPTMHTDALARTALERDLQFAPERGEIEPYFMPEFNLQTDECHGLEVLMRWHRPSHGLALPESFLPIAEESGIIGLLGEFNFRAACVQFRTWIDAGIVPDHLYLSFNLSHRETRLPGLVRTVERILGETGIPPTRIRFEMSAHLLAAVDEVRAKTVANLYRLGVKLTVDKFQAGPSSLVLFRDLFITGIKVEHSFHEKLMIADPEGEISRSMVATARKLKTHMTIVGLENERQLVCARATGFHYGQGFHLSPPLKARGVAHLFS